MSRSIKLRSINSKLRQDQIAKVLSYSSSTLQHYRHDIKLQNPYKSNGPKRTQKPQMTSNDLIRSQKIELIKPVSNELMRYLRVALPLRINFF